MCEFIRKERRNQRIAKDCMQSRKKLEKRVDSKGKVWYSKQAAWCSTDNSEKQEAMSLREESPEKRQTGDACNSPKQKRIPFFINKADTEL